MKTNEITLDQIRQLPDDERPVQILIHMFSGRVVKAEGEGALELYRAMVQGRKR